MRNPLQTLHDLVEDGVFFGKQRAPSESNARCQKKYIDVATSLFDQRAFTRDMGTQKVQYLGAPPKKIQTKTNLWVNELLWSLCSGFITSTSRLPRDTGGSLSVSYLLLLGVWLNRMEVPLLPFVTIGAMSLRAFNEIC